MIIFTSFCMESAPTVKVSIIKWDAKTSFFSLFMKFRLVAKIIKPFLLKSLSEFFHSVICKCEKSIRVLWTQFKPLQTLKMLHPIQPERSSLIIFCGEILLVIAFQRILRYLLICLFACAEFCLIFLADYTKYFFCIYQFDYFNSFELEPQTLKSTNWYSKFQVSVPLWYRYSGWTLLLWVTHCPSLLFNANLKFKEIKIWTLVT